MFAPTLLRLRPAKMLLVLFRRLLIDQLGQFAGVFRSLRAITPISVKWPHKPFSNCCARGATSISRALCRISAAWFSRERTPTNRIEDRVPDQLAPIVRNTADRERELVMARWGMPGPPQFGGQPVTNIRNVSSPHWRGWLSARNRCLVPAQASRKAMTEGWLRTT